MNGARRALSEAARLASELANLDSAILRRRDEVIMNLRRGSWQQAKQCYIEMDRLLDKRLELCPTNSKLNIDLWIQDHSSNAKNVS